MTANQFALPIYFIVLLSFYLFIVQISRKLYHQRESVFVTKPLTASN